MIRVFALILIAAGLSALRADSERPNIVFFFADDQPSSALGCYGNPIVKTPTLDHLAAEGTRFSSAFVSQPICWVSRASILTGLHARSYGTANNRDLARAETVETLYPDILKQNGYRTRFYGKWHARMPASFKPESHFGEYEFIDRDPYFKKLPDSTLRHETDLIVDRGIEFVKRQPKGKPFALNLWFNATHAEDHDRRPGIGHFPGCNPPMVCLTKSSLLFLASAHLKFLKTTPISSKPPSPASAGFGVGTLHTNIKSTCEPISA